MSEGPTIDVPVPMPPPPNGDRKVRQLQAAYVASLLGLCILLRGALALASFVWQPAQWDVVNSTATDLNVLTVALMGGLLGITRPGT